MSLSFYIVLFNLVDESYFELITILPVLTKFHMYNLVLKRKEGPQFAHQCEVQLILPSNSMYRRGTKFFVTHLHNCSLFWGQAPNILIKNTIKMIAQCKCEKCLATNFGCLKWTMTQSMQTFSQSRGILGTSSTDTLLHSSYS